jgi:hypothetical protein
MDGKTIRAIVAFVVAPLTPLVLLWAVAPPRRLSDLPFVPLAALLWTYPWALGVGIPVYVIIARHGTLRIWHVLGIAGGVGFLAMGSYSWKLVGALLGAAIGLSAGITFWLIWYRKPVATPPP